MERFLTVLKSLQVMPMPIKLKKIYRENFTSITVHKGDIIQPLGTVNDCLYFVEKGLFQLYSEREGKQVTVRFKKEDDFIVCLEELFPDSKEDALGIEALEDGILWQIPGSVVSPLKHEFPAFIFQFIIIMVKDMNSANKAMECSREDGGSDNYDALCKSSPELLSRVPISYLASYTELPEKVFRHLHSSKIKLKVSTARRRRS